MKSMFDQRWDPVIFVHGYGDNYAVAKYLVDLTENDEVARGGGRKGVSERRCIESGLL